MNEDKSKYYIEMFVKNLDKVRAQTLKNNFYDIDNLSLFYLNLLNCINCIESKEDDNKNKNLNPYFEQIKDLNPYSEQIIRDSFFKIAEEGKTFIYLLISGFYDSAVKSLRQILEIFIDHYYFSILEERGLLKKYIVHKGEFYKLKENLTNDEKEFIKKYEKEKIITSEDYKKIFEKGDFYPIYEADPYFCWNYGKKYLKEYDSLKNKPILADFPSFKECLDTIFEQNIFKRKEISKLNLKEEIDTLYKDLSKILHDRRSIKDMQTLSGFPTNDFNENALKKVIELYKKIEEIIAILLLLGSYPNYNKNTFIYIPKYRQIKEILENYK